MPLPAPLVPVERLRAVPLRDDYGDEVRNFQSGNTVTATLSGHVQITGSVERKDSAGRNYIATSATFWFPDPNADVLPDDRLRCAGLTWDIEGRPVRFDQIPELAHLQVNVITSRG